MRKKRGPWENERSSCVMATCARRRKRELPKERLFARNPIAARSSPLLLLLDEKKTKLSFFSHAKQSVRKSTSQRKPGKNPNLRRRGQKRRLEKDTFVSFHDRTEEVWEKMKHPEKFSQDLGESASKQALP